METLDLSNNETISAWLRQFDVAKHPGSMIVLGECEAIRAIKAMAEQFNLRGESPGRRSTECDARILKEENERLKKELAALQATVSLADAFRNRERNL